VTPLTIDIYGAVLTVPGRNKEAVKKEGKNVKKK
jgi:hypothetical protein